ncbi:Mog1p/PsbP-like protein [Glonium stellatum]|uniref:Mog1p/PsbP-like protein n=1 Tax=Glonium stellatum TaxID=574774 RepID=A0A8E2ENK9_9PEZI|nr:Mog1p/PsbP-like protein [Glonium stellatum]
MAFQPTQLFGGAITVDLPTSFSDVSSIRQVPDHQEVYLDRNGFTSIIFDITERVENVTTDEEALKFHFDDIVSGSAEGTQYFHSGTTTLAKMPNIPTYTLFATQHPHPPTISPNGASVPRKPTPDFTGILLLLVRLVEQKTDIVVTVNVPHVQGEYASEAVDLAAANLGPLMGGAVKVQEKFLETFDIKDWSLFVN